jgi:hypothetical protein
MFASLSSGNFGMMPAAGTKTAKETLQKQKPKAKSKKIEGAKR